MVYENIVVYKILLLFKLILYFQFSIIKELYISFRQFRTFFFRNYFKRKLFCILVIILFKLFDVGYTELITIIIVCL